MARIEVEEVGGGKALTRFTDLPRALHGHDPRFAPPVLAWERYRVDRRRNPYLAQAEGAFLMASRSGRPVGRIALHVPNEGAAVRFGLWSCADDGAVAGALVEAAAAWAVARGRSTLVGPWSFEPGDGHGLLVAGFDVPGTTGRPWAPPHEALVLKHALAALGPVRVLERASLWRVTTTSPGTAEAIGAAEHRGSASVGGPAPGQAGPYGDPRLVLDGVAAVPDLSQALRTTGLRGAWALARRARHRDWEGCTAVRWDGDPEASAVALLSAGGAAGYRWAVVPWSPDPSGAPEAVHERLGVEL